MLKRIKKGLAIVLSATMFLGSGVIASAAENPSELATETEEKELLAVSAEENGEEETAQAEESAEAANSEATDSEITSTEVSIEGETTESETETTEVTVPETSETSGETVEATKEEPLVQEPGIFMGIRVSFKGNGGTGSMEDLILLPDETGRIPANGFKKTGYKIRSWNTKPDGSGDKYTLKGKINIPLESGIDELTLYAQWAPVDYKIQYITHGANSNPNPKTYTINSGRIDFKAPKKKGYKFLGWYLNSARTKKITHLRAKRTGNVKVYAKWAMVKYTIKYVLNGGKNSPKNKTSYKVEYKTFKFYNPTRNGYQFKGWYKDSAFKQRSTKIVKGTVGNKVRYAKWSPNRYTIHYNGNGATSGSMKDSTGVKVDTAYHFRKNRFVKDGYTFLGFSAMPDGSSGTYKPGDLFSNLTFKNNGEVTVFAQWVKTWSIITKFQNGMNWQWLAHNGELYPGYTGDITIDGESYRVSDSHIVGKFATPNPGQYLVGLAGPAYNLTAGALRVLGVPYVHAGQSYTTGMDCSWFTMQSYAHIGINIPRNSAAQGTVGAAVNPRNPAEWRPGDLVLYTDPATGKIGHAAIYIGNGNVLQCSLTATRVVVSPWDYTVWKVGTVRRFF